LSGLPVDGDAKENLVWKALQLLRRDFTEKITPIAIHLHKSIPMGAGLGGGSSDAAFMLKLLNDYFKLEITQERLLSYALQLGSDCPFFIINKPCVAKGRGEVLKEVGLDLSVYDIKVVSPDIHVSTSGAYESIVSAEANFDLAEIATLPIKEWKNLIINDFEEPVFNKFPELKAIKEQLYKDGALYASMSGSGSSVYGIFEKKE
jgi:4-diphosphocytidyl-2-C-methyl-D-erythritol kinase